MGGGWSASWQMPHFSVFGEQNPRVWGLFCWIGRSLLPSTLGLVDLKDCLRPILGNFDEIQCFVVRPCLVEVRCYTARLATAVGLR